VTRPDLVAFDPVTEADPVAEHLRKKILDSSLTAVTVICQETQFFHNITKLPTQFHLRVSASSSLPWMHLVCLTIKACAIYLQTFSSRTGAGRKPRGNQPTQDHLGNCRQSDWQWSREKKASGL